MVQSSYGGQENSSTSLDLYVKVEDLLGIEDATVTLHEHYIDFLKTIQPHRLLDVGCGSGAFLLKTQTFINEVKGLDLSPLMVQRTRAKGLNVACIDLCEVEESYDVITAVFDMVNYLNPQQLKTFMHCVERRLTQGGYFICDINTLFGFESVAVGAYIAEDTERFLAMESDFDANIYSLEMTLFEKEKNLFQKSQAYIQQYYYTVDKIVEMSGLSLHLEETLFLYDLEEADKQFIVLKKLNQSHSLYKHRKQMQ
jgi:predicted TPR repeat methyltransferase